MTNQRRHRNLRSVLLANDPGEPARARVMETAFWRPSSAPRGAFGRSGGAVIDLAARRALGSLA